MYFLLHLLLFSQSYLIGCVACREVSAFRPNSGTIKGEGGGAWGWGSRRQQYRELSIFIFFSITLLIQFTLALSVLASWLYCSSLLPLRRVRTRGGERKAAHTRGGRHRHNQELGRGWGPPSLPGGRGKGTVNRGQIYSPVSLSFFSIDLFATNFPHNLWYFWLLCALSPSLQGLRLLQGASVKGKRQENWKLRPKRWKQRGGESLGKLSWDPKQRAYMDF